MSAQRCSLAKTVFGTLVLLSGSIVWASPCVITNEAQVFAFQSSARGTNNYTTLSWASCPDHLYEVQVSDDPVQAVWQRRAVMAGGDGTTSWTDTNTPAHPQQFYRVQRLRFGGDEDGDGLFNLDEFNRGTDLRNPDSDNDGMLDAWEVQNRFNPLSSADTLTDPDGDGYSNLQEHQLHTKPRESYSNPAYLPRNLVAWWKLDEGVGTNVFDSSLNRHEGLVRGGNPAGKWTTGYFSNAVTLGGPSNIWIEVPYHPSLVPTQELTLTGWVKPSGQGVLIGNWDPIGPGNGNYRVQFGPDHIELWFSPTGGGSHTTMRFDPNWSTNDWHHLAVRYTGNTLAVFVDGESRDSRTVIGPIVPVPNAILIGDPSLAETCLVDDVHLYSRALGTNELASMSKGNGLPITMIVGQTATLRAFGALETDTCEWSIVSGRGFFTNTANCTVDFRPSWSGAVTVQVVVARSGVLSTNRFRTVVAFPSLSPISVWNDPLVGSDNNCYNFATDIRTDTFAQPGGGSPYECPLLSAAAVSDGLQAGVDLADLAHTSGLPAGHIAALIIYNPFILDYHWLRLEADGTWSHKPGNLQATTLDNSGSPITDPRTANFVGVNPAQYHFCGFFWVGPDVHIK